MIQLCGTKCDYSSKYSSTSAFLRRSSKMPSSSSFVGSLGGRRSLGERKGMNAAAASALRSAVSSLGMLSVPFDGTTAPVFDFFVVSSVPSVTSISTSSSGAFRFDSPCPADPAGGSRAIAKACSPCRNSNS